MAILNFAYLLRLLKGAAPIPREVLACPHSTLRYPRADQLRPPSFMRVR